MIPSLIVTAAALAVSGAIAWRLGGSLGAGVLAGFLCGASIAGLGAAWQRHVIRTRPERILAATVASFLFKLFALVSLAIALRFVAAAAERVDWRSFLVTFAAAVLVVMVTGALDNARALRSGSGSVRGAVSRRGAL